MHGIRNPYTFNDPDGEFANFLAKAALDFALEVAVQVATTGEVDLGAAAIETAKGLVNPAKTLQRVRVLAKIASSSRKAAKAATFAANKAKGAAGEAAALGKRGDQIAGKQVTFETSDGTRTRIDGVTTDKVAVEVKTGNAKLSPGQAKLQSDVAAGNPVTPVGANADRAGLDPGMPTTLNGFEVDREL